MTDLTKNEINRLIDAYQKDIDRLVDKRNALAELTCQQQLAVMLHKHNCHWNHTDGCSWEYEGNDWVQPAHALWLKKANKLYDFMRTIWSHDHLILKHAEELILLLKD